jgi:hypothetical protein
MDFLSGISGAGGLLSAAKSLISEFHLSEEDRIKFELEMQKLLSEASSQLQQSFRQELESREKIITAEMASGDKFTRWARPAIVWSGLVFILITNVLLPCYAFLSGDMIPDLSLDPKFWDAWTVVVSVWAGGRTLEKVGIKNIFAGKK